MYSPDTEYKEPTKTQRQSIQHAMGTRDLSHLHVHVGIGTLTPKLLYDTKTVHTTWALEI